MREEEPLHARTSHFSLDGPCPMPHAPHTFPDLDVMLMNHPLHEFLGAQKRVERPKDSMQNSKTFELYELGSKSTLDFSTRGNTRLIEVVPEFFLKFFKTALWLSATPKMLP